MDTGNKAAQGPILGLMHVHVHALFILYQGGADLPNGGKMSQGVTLAVQSSIGSPPRYDERLGTREAQRSGKFGRCGPSRNHCRRDFRLLFVSFKQSQPILFSFRQFFHLQRAAPIQFRLHLFQLPQKPGSGFKGIPFRLIKYAATTVGEREMPAEQWTTIFPEPFSDAIASSMISQAASAIFEMDDETESLSES
ncbi:hypothetical protein BJV77DRAFT_1150176 [Russula vinacea]|nr:hypothetical protein BJV77DRAFT_1150176 [Russula vinacea]